MSPALAPLLPCKLLRNIPVVAAKKVVMPPTKLPCLVQLTLALHAMPLISERSGLSQQSCGNSLPIFHSFSLRPAVASPCQQCIGQQRAKLCASFNVAFTLRSPCSCCADLCSRLNVSVCSLSYALLPIHMSVVAAAALRFTLHVAAYWWSPPGYVWSLTMCLIGIDLACKF